MLVIGAHNIPGPGGALLVANYTSQEDPALIQSATGRPVRFPPLPEVRRLLEAGELVCIFPEMAPSRTGTVETFSREIEPFLRELPSVPIIPIYLLRHRRNNVEVLCAGSPVRVTGAAALRNCVVELACDACEGAKTAQSTLAHRLIAQCRANWEALAIVDSSRKRYTFGEVLTAAVIVRNWVAKRGGEKTIGIYLPTSTTAAIVNYGVTLAGKIAVNLNFTAGEQNCRRAVATAELGTVLTSRLFLEKMNLPQWPEMVMVEELFAAFGETTRAFSAARNEPIETLTQSIHPDDTACIVFSSGSTGVPKGVALTHWNVLENADGCEALFPITGSDCMLGVLPFFHSFGYTFALWFPLLEGFRAVYHSNPTDARVIGELAKSESATFMLSTPTFALQYARKIEAEQFRTLQYILVGAEKLRDSVAAEFRSHFGFSLLAGYGCTELGPGVAINRPDVRDAEAVHIGTRAGSVGRPLRGIAIRIAHPETGAELPNGQQGMVLVNGPSRMQGYYHSPELTAKVMRDGYYVTGDLGYVDDDGFLYITDRLARFSKIGGEMVPHLRIEEAVSELTQAFVTGVPDPLRGERLVLLFPEGTATAGQIHACLSSAGLPPLWVPKRENLYAVSEIPTLPTGKVDLRRARELASACRWKSSKEN